MQYFNIYQKSTMSLYAMVLADSLEDAIQMTASMYAMPVERFQGVAGPAQPKAPKSMLIALMLINKANGNQSLDEKALEIQRYIDMLISAALEHAYPINNYCAGMPLYHEIVETFSAPLPRFDQGEN